jgi:SHAQKYF class myb-like DNA-binding protein
VCAPGTEHTGSTHKTKQSTAVNGPYVGRWTKEEHEKFLEALKKHGKEWKKVAAHVGTRTVVQTRTHAQKYFQKLQKVREVLYTDEA